MFKVEDLMSETLQKNGPWWLSYPNYWPEQQEITPKKKYAKEANMIKEFMCIGTEKLEEFYWLLKSFESWKVFWITS